MEILIDILRIIAIIVCFAAPAYAIIYFDDDNAEM
jgi:hypothetical protein